MRGAIYITNLRSKLNKRRRGKKPVPIKDEPERREGKTLYFLFAERQGSRLREHPAKPNLPQRGGIIGGKVCIHTQATKVGKQYPCSGKQTSCREYRFS
ncbi:MAG TPA: hypothetical protein VEK32_09395 [Thermodesulfobacteriota bacterium]|nr:hypothetical protein [Thermodesulfobacteriota bacterium]